MTTERLAATGVSDGWHCLELGAGNGSIARWLADRVAPTGTVVATDVERGRIGDHPNLTTAVHDVRVEPLPENRFDLIAARLVLQQLAERDSIMAALVRALKPGGWLQIEELDTAYEPPLLTADERSAQVYQKFLTAKTTLMRARGGDPEWGRRVASAMRVAGLVDIDPRPYVQLRHARSADLQLQVNHTYQLRDGLVSVGMTDEELAEVRAVMRDPSFRASSSVMYSVQGRKERQS
ncbi:methyltransferase domain-containing protein [Saccharopolyspora erythraea]|uniref:methyltransferase domain-containing protein n=1 Tax=Saccharopolyspora erythraea TaxID=1836 RepID=UPI0032C23D01